jgi:hypothetical protein
MSFAEVGGQDPLIDPEIAGLAPPTRLLFPIAAARAAATFFTAALVQELLDAPPVHPDDTNTLAPASAAASAARCASLRTV